MLDVRGGEGKWERLCRILKSKISLACLRRTESKGRVFDWRAEKRGERKWEASFRAKSCTDSIEWAREEEEGSQTEEQYSRWGRTRVV